MGARDPQDLELEGDITVTSQPLKYERAEDLLPDMMGIGALLFQHAGEALDKLGTASLRKLDVPAVAAAFAPLLGGMSERLRAGELKRLAPLILNSTALVYPDGEGKKVRRDLSIKDDRARAFEEHPELYFIALGFAAKVTFGKFFPAIGPLVQKLKSLMMKAPSHQAAATEDTQS